MPPKPTPPRSSKPVAVPQPQKPEPEDRRPFKVVTYKGNGRQPWRYKLVGLNGQTLTTSEGYLTKWNRDRAVSKAGFAASGIEVNQET